MKYELEFKCDEAGLLEEMTVDATGVESPGAAVAAIFTLPEAFGTACRRYVKSLNGVLKKGADKDEFMTLVFNHMVQTFQSSLFAPEEERWEVKK